ncbi:MAG: hypothetical protein ACOYME_06625 [Prochlorotrichaceae cyanobacterium]
MPTYSLGSVSSHSTTRVSTVPDSLIHPDRLRQLYKAPHQAEFLCLQAEAETLVRQLQLQIQRVKASQENDRPLETIPSIED